MEHSLQRERIKQEVTFKYSSFTITPDARCDTEKKKRITLSRDTFSKLKSSTCDEAIDYRRTITLAMSKTLYKMNNYLAVTGRSLKFSKCYSAFH